MAAPTPEASRSLPLFTKAMQLLCAYALTAFPLLLNPPQSVHSLQRWAMFEVTIISLVLGLVACLSSMIMLAGA